jgi:hypothetical protein
MDREISMEDEGLRKILEILEEGKAEEARLALRSYLTEAHEAPTHEVRYVLGRTWFEQDKAAARYLFEEALALEPGFAEAGQYVARCGSALEDLESFNDDRHPACDVCALRYRDCEPCCPYCGSAAAAPLEEADDTVEAQLRQAGQEVVDSIRSFGEREDVQQAKEKVVDAGQQALAKAKEVAESEKARELREKALVLGQKTKEKAKEISGRKEVQQAKERATTLGKEAVEKARNLGERDDVKKAVGQAQEKSRNAMNRIQNYLAEEQRRINDAEGAEKGKLIGKWFLIVLAVLIVLKFLFGGE